MSNKLHFAHTWQVHYTSEETFNLDSVQFKELMIQDFVLREAQFGVRLS